jgi:molecular chaperone GrpE
VEGPEVELEPVREQAHEEPGLAEKVAALEAERAQLVERLQRLAADFENHRRRAREEAAGAVTRGREQVVRALLPALDSLDLALAHSADEGVRLVARQIDDALRSLGVERVAPAEGDAFDARLHEAVAKEEPAAAAGGARPAPGTVLHLLARGYALDGRVLRPARVVVGG